MEQPKAPPAAPVEVETIDEDDDRGNYKPTLVLTVVSTIPALPVQEPNVGADETPGVPRSVQVRVQAKRYTLTWLEENIPMQWHNWRREHSTQMLTCSFNMTVPIGA